MKPCSNTQCRLSAIWGIDTCWQHLSDIASWRNELVESIPQTLIPVGSNFTECDLSGLDLTGLNAQGCNFTGACFDGSTVRSSNLRGSVLRRCSANNANFSDSDLSETSSYGFSGIQLIATNTNFINSCFRFSYLPEADLERSILTGSDWQGSDLSKSILDNTRCIDWFAPHIDLSDSTMKSSDLRFAVLGGAVMIRVNASKSNFQRANLCGIKGRNSSFSGADLYYVRFNAANLDNADLSNSEITRTVFRTASLIDTNLYGSSKEKAIWDRTRLSLTDK